MGQIVEPIKDWNIIFTYFHWTADHRGKQWYADRFKTIARLKEYFIRNPAAGYLVGYGKNTTGWIYAFEGHLELEWTDQVGTHKKDFISVFDFARFLEDNPPLAKCVEYVKKEKK